MPFRSISNFELILQNGTPTVINANIGEYFYSEKLSKIFSHCHKKDFFLVHTNLSLSKYKNKLKEFLFNLDYQLEAIAIFKTKFNFKIVSNIDIKNYNF